MLRVCLFEFVSAAVDEVAAPWNVWVASAAQNGACHACHTATQDVGMGITHVRVLHECMSSECIRVCACVCVSECMCNRFVCVV